MNNKDLQSYLTKEYKDFSFYVVVFDDNKGYRIIKHKKEKYLANALQIFEGKVANYKDCTICLGIEWNNGISAIDLIQKKPNMALLFSKDYEKCSIENQSELQEILKGIEILNQ